MDLIVEETNAFADKQIKESESEDFFCSEKRNVIFFSSAYILG